MCAPTLGICMLTQHKAHTQRMLDSSTVPSRMNYANTSQPSRTARERGCIEAGGCLVSGWECQRTAPREQPREWFAVRARKTAATDLSHTRTHTQTPITNKFNQTSSQAGLGRSYFDERTDRLGLSEIALGQQLGHAANEQNHEIEAVTPQSTHPRRECLISASRSSIKRATGIHTT